MQSKVPDTKLISCAPEVLLYISAFLRSFPLSGEADTLLTSLVNLGINGHSSQSTFTTKPKLSGVPSQAGTGQRNGAGCKKWCRGQDPRRESEASFIYQRDHANG